MALYLFSSKLKVGSKYLYLTWCAFEYQVRKIFTNTVIQGKKQSNAKKKRKGGTFRCPPAKHYGRLAMFCGLLALDKFQSGPYASRKCVVTLNYAVLVGKSW
jgi:hypothetical protein